MLKSNISTGGYKKCSDKHKPVAINVKGTTYYVHGGSCTNPGGSNSLKGVDVFVGLDMGMKATRRRYPWCAGVEFLFRIPDMGVPSNLEEFKNLLVYLSGVILDGKRVFIGCIGGHGRTGLVLAALMTHMTGDKDSISYLRKVYCEKAVESKAQVDWLHTHYGITKVEALKGLGGLGTYSGYTGGSGNWVSPSMPKRTEILVPIKTAYPIFAGCDVS